MSNNVSNKCDIALSTEVLPVVFTIVFGLWVIASSVNVIKIALHLRYTNLPWLAVLLLGILDLIYRYNI